MIIPCRNRVEEARSIWSLILKIFWNWSFLINTKFVLGLNRYAEFLLYPIYKSLYGSKFDQTLIQAATWPHKKDFIETMAPLLRLILMFCRMPLERCVVTENDLFALLRNEALNNFSISIVAGPWDSVWLTPAAFTCCR